MDMTPDQVEVVREFVDELVSLGILQRASQEEVVTTTPLFVVPKPGQEGQWRVIADMLRGGQNAASANDPVFLNRPLYILEQMYAGGWTAVVDASKFFYQGTPQVYALFQGVRQTGAMSSRLVTLHMNTFLPQFGPVFGIEMDYSSTYPG